MAIISDIVNKIRTTLSAELGVFTSINRPAVAVFPSKYDDNITGILALVERTTNTAPISLLGGSVYYPDIYRISLINYDETENSKLSIAIRKLSLVFTIVGQSYIPGGKSSETYEQAYIDVFYPSYDTN